MEQKAVREAELTGTEGLEEELAEQELNRKPLAARPPDHAA
jgi:hypothetical protein